MAVSKRIILGWTITSSLKLSLNNQEYSFQTVSVTKPAILRSVRRLWRAGKTAVMLRESIMGCKPITPRSHQSPSSPDITLHHSCRHTRDGWVCCLCNSALIFSDLHKHWSHNGLPLTLYVWVLATAVDIQYKQANKSMHLRWAMQMLWRWNCAFLIQQKQSCRASRAASEAINKVNPYRIHKLHIFLYNVR